MVEMDKRTYFRMLILLLEVELLFLWSIVQVVIWQVFLALRQEVWYWPHAAVHYSLLRELAIFWSNNRWQDHKCFKNSRRHSELSCSLNLRCLKKYCELCSNGYLLQSANWFPENDFGQLLSLLKSSSFVFQKPSQVWVVLHEKVIKTSWDL